MDVLMSRRYTGMSEVQILRRLTQLTAPVDQRKLAVYFARDYPADNLLKSNAIIIGSKRSNPWAEPFDRLMNFRFELYKDSNITTIRNAPPQPGEQANYDQPRAVVALLPNLRGNGNALLLAGSNMDGTDAAGEFVTTERWLSQLQQRLGTPSTGPFPHFEALLHIRRLSAGVIEHIEILATRVH